MYQLSKSKYKKQNNPYRGFWRILRKRNANIQKSCLQVIKLWKGTFKYTCINFQTNYPALESNLSYGAL